MTSYAQNKEDLVLARYFGERVGIYVDVGAHDGMQFSNTYLLELKGWNGVCIEPHPASYAQLQRNRPKAAHYRMACGEKRDMATLHVPNGFNVLGSLTDQYRKEMANILRIPQVNLKLATFEVPVMPLRDILANAGWPVGSWYEVLSVDTEWTELDVLKGAGLGEYVPEVIVVEANTRALGLDLKDYMARQGYDYCGIVGGINHFYTIGDTAWLEGSIEYVMANRS